MKVSVVCLSIVDTWSVWAQHGTCFRTPYATELATELLLMARSVCCTGRFVNLVSLRYAMHTASQTEVGSVCYVSE